MAKDFNMQKWKKMPFDMDFFAFGYVQGVQMTKVFPYIIAKNFTFAIGCFLSSQVLP